MANVLSGVTVSVNNAEPVPGEMCVDHEWIDASAATASKPDPRWFVVDQLGHYHAFDNDDNLPTLKPVSVDVPCNGCGDNGCEGYTVTEYHCELCDEVVEPRYMCADPHRVIPGRTSWQVVVYGGPNRNLGERVSLRVDRDGKTIAFGFGQSAGRGFVVGEIPRVTYQCWPMARRAVA